MPAMRRMLLVRHAECEMNLTVAARVGGRSNDSPLTPLGVKQAQAVGRHLAGCVARHPRLGPCFTSTALRAKDTMHVALEAARAAGHPWLCSPKGLHHPVEASEELLELSQGEWEGQLRNQVYTPEALAAISRDPWNFAAPGGESQRQVEERMTVFVTERVLPRLERDGPPALLVTHGLAIKWQRQCLAVERSFLRGILGSDASFSRKIATDNTSTTEVAWVEHSGGASWELLRVNDCTHHYLDGIARTNQ